MAQALPFLAQNTSAMVQNAPQAVHKVQSEAQTVTTALVSPVRALILTGFGINCEEEFAAAYRLAGAEATVVHLNQVLHGQVSIHDFDILNFPGGFSFGDDLGSGVVLANKLRYRQTAASGRTLLDDIKQFVAAGKFVLGICNGFQVLVKLGLLPNLSGDVRPEVTLTHNTSGRYEDRWVKLRVNPRTQTPFLKGIDTLEVPVRHGEGRLVIPDEAVQQRIEAAGLNCLSYLDANGDGTSVYPFNPNGAALNCAGLTDPTGQVFGLMPHPEAFLSAYNHPDWARRRRAGQTDEEGEGLRIFKNIVAHIAHSRLPHPPSPLSGGEGEPDNSFLVEKPAGDYGTGPTAGIEGRLTADRNNWEEKLKPFGRHMRHHATEAEDVLWQAVRDRQLANVKFRRQHTIGPFTVDFFSPDHQLIVEVDGGVHAETEQAEYDAGRIVELEKLGYQLIRFSNDEVLNSLPSVLQQIQTALTKQTSNPTA
ncbi:phosphoribosylformylglycinamidine synthase subunit PurQ [Hymenobacter sp. BT664]|uniref:Phosphoribosylformylglycinamidine synthase subunit PurQ n=1 Tax=Hymenobacter montanus TaxID=2771359 RepID=A0A927BCA7_9BACT|nr:phosphoribosylformylglycinamidine synthase subunit PurQ [Hymenobacter montanus]MBD2767489.1 phosphoribosylformylglycinamidine synthase subunit PurQ [Hymenobacter montanus]